jgi:peptidoglycan/LPS O-acetylase OafA/YrhL
VRDLSQVEDRLDEVAAFQEGNAAEVLTANGLTTQTPANPSKPNRNLGLDLLRTVAVTLVLGRHMTLPPNSSPLMLTWYECGWVGVDLFFVLSGFLISSLLFNEHKKNGFIDVKRFLIRRAFKIYPAFWVFIAVSICITFYETGDVVSARNLVGELLFLQNYVGAMWHHTWSLAVEEHFYLGVACVFALMQLYRPGHDFRFIPRLFVATALVCLCLRFFTTLILSDFNWRANVFATHIRIDSLFFGVLIAYLCHFRNAEKKLNGFPSWLLVVVGCLMLSPASAFRLDKTPWLYTVGFMSLYAGSGLFLFAALRLQSCHSWFLTQVGTLGACSYSVYLWHMPVNHYAQSWMNRSSSDSRYLTYMLIYIAGSFIFGYLMNRLIEFPALELRDRLCPPKAASSISKAPG